MRSHRAWHQSFPHRVPTISLLPALALTGALPVPNALQPDKFQRLIDTIFSHFGCHDPVISIELDPRTMTRDWADVIKRIGIERASLGVQTFSPQCQQAIGRIQSEDCIVRTVDWLREAGVTSLNFDLMYGLPGQSMHDLEDTLHRTRVLGADRIALFGYAHVPHIVPRQRVIDTTDLPDQAERFAMAEMGYAYLATHGYTPIGFDHFAKPKKPIHAFSNLTIFCMHVMLFGTNLHAKSGPI